MLLGPVFRYELYSIARRARYFWLRGLFGLVLLGFMWISYADVAYRSESLSIDQSAELASQFFVSFAWLALLAVLMLTPALSAGVIATERERRTIEYLFATDLSNAEIVLSKLFARLLLIGLLLITALPILAIFRLMGGIPGDRLLAAFSILASTGVVVTAASIAISVWSPRGRDALGRVYLVLIAVLLLPMIVMVFTRGGAIAPNWWLGHWLGWLLEWTMAVNPLWSLGQMSWNAGAVNMQSLWRMLTGHAVLSIALVALAVSAVRRVHLNSAGSGEVVRRGWRWWTIALPRWRRPLGTHAMLWKEIFARTASTRLGLLGRFAGALVLGGLLWALGSAYWEAVQHGQRWNYFDEMALSLGSAIGSGMLLLCGARAASLVTYEKERDTWLSILSTPMTGREILTAKFLGNLYAFRWLAAILLLVWGMAATLNSQFLYVIPFLLGTLLLLAAFATLVGLCYSLQLSTSLRASTATMATLFFVGGGYLFCCCMPLMFSGPNNSAEHFMLATCGPALLVAPGAMLEDDFLSDEMASNYILGMIIYSIATVALWLSLERYFDKWSGRVGCEQRSPESSVSKGDAA